MIANAWAEAYIAEDLDRRFGATRDARDLLEERLQQTRERLEAAERAVIAYASAQGLVTVATQDEDGNSAGTASQTLVASELAGFNEALQQATAERIAAEAALASRSGATSASEEDYGSGAAASLRSRRAELRVELAELRSRFAENYPPVQALEAQIAELDRVISQEQSTSRDRLRANYNEAIARENRLRSRVGELRDSFLSQREDSVEYNILQREVDTSREIYAGLLQRYREIGVVGVGESNVLIVDPARAPSTPSSPSLLQNMALALIAGILLAAASLYAREFFNRTLRDPQMVKERLGLNLLGTIPRSDQDKIVDDLMHSYTELYESYFSLSSSLAFAAGGTAPRSIMVTSSQPGEGKSLTALAIAYMLSLQGKKVMLLDADLRKSGLGKYVDSGDTTGVTQYLMGNEDWRSMIKQPHPLGGFDMIIAGRKPQSAAELLANGRFHRLLDDAEANYDHVVVDGPPVLGLADAPMISSSMDGILLVIEANRSNWRTIQSAILRLQQSNGEILGAAVTKLDERNSMYGYGTSYGYGFEYGTNEKAERQEDAVA